MDFSLHRIQHRTLEAFQSRVPGLSAKIAKLRFPFWGWATPLIFLLAFLAHQGSQQEGRIEWLVNHPPTAESWQVFLARKGYGPVEDPDWKEKAYAEMPEASRLKTSAYLSENRSVIAVRTTGEWVYFRFVGNGNKAGGGQIVNRELWEPLGLGWEAVATIDQLELPKLEIAKKSEKRPSEWEDARRLSF